MHLLFCTINDDYRVLGEILTNENHSLYRVRRTASSSPHATTNATSKFRRLTKIADHMSTCNRRDTCRASARLLALIARIKLAIAAQGHIRNSR
jgi:hypothetical protein